MWGTGSNPGLRGNPSDIQILAKAANLVSRPFKRKANYSSKYSARRSRIPRGITTHKYVRRCQPFTLTLNQLTGIHKIQNVPMATPTFGFGLGFALDQVLINSGSINTTITNTYADLCALYDQYKIERVTVDILWSNNDVYPGNSYVLPTLQTTVDTTDITNPINNTTLTQYSGFRLQQLGSKSRFRHTFRPSVNESTSTTGVSGSVGTISRKSPFLSCDTPDVVHAGYKAFWDLPAGTATNVGDGALQVYVTYYITCKMVK